MTAAQDPHDTRDDDPAALRARVLQFTHKSRACGFEHTAAALEDIFAALLERAGPVEVDRDAGTRCAPRVETR